MLVVILFTLVTVPSMAFGATFVGTIQGFLCVTHGVTCPVGQEDVVAAAENVFVLYQGPDKPWYFVPNINSKLMARALNKKVKIVGKLDTKGENRIIAEVGYIMESNGKWRKAWSADLMDSIYEDILGSSPYKRGK